MSLHVKLGEQWHDNPNRSALARFFTVDSYHTEENGPSCSVEEARYVYCSPMFVSNAGGHRSDAMEGFFADMDDFAPKSDRYLPVLERFE